MIRAENLVFRVPGKTLVDDVSLEIADGEVLAILGPNGAGKSTLFKMLCGQNRPASGKIFYGDRELVSMDVQELARCRAVLPQSGTVPFDFTAREIVTLGRSPHVFSGEKGQDSQIVLEAMRLTETAHLADRSVGTLSGGELQRVHLARVLAQIWNEVDGRSRALFLDEPTSSLDLSHQHGTLKLARTWAARGVAVAVILHDLNLAAVYADRLMLIQGGRAVAAGNAREVLTPENIRQIFDLETRVESHPEKNCPLVIPL